jgi:hypothetical protein
LRLTARPNLARSSPTSRAVIRKHGPSHRLRARAIVDVRFSKKPLDSSHSTRPRDLATRAQIARETRHDARQHRFFARAVPRRETRESSRTARTAAPKITVVFVNAC